MTEFNPPPLLKNRHIQSILSSTGPRKWLLRTRAQTLLKQSTHHLLDGGDGIQLTGAYTQNRASRGLVIMIHGWEGCIDSLYLLSAGSALHASGYSIFRLNLRDHGNSHHLNKELFNSTRLKEVLNAVKHVQQLYPHDNNFMAGFSLGGNFVLRIAANAKQHNITLNKVAAVCPVINPLNTMKNLEQGWFVYHDYFRRKWARSLTKKLQHFPELGYGDNLLKLKTLSQMNNYFVPNHTDYNDTESYLMGYAIGGDVLAQLSVPSHIISSKDDPVIQASDLSLLAKNPNLNIELTQYGGHCGYLNSYRLHSWIDQRLTNLFA